MLYAVAFNGILTHRVIVTMPLMIPLDYAISRHCNCTHCLVDLNLHYGILRFADEC